MARGTASPRAAAAVDAAAQGSSASPGRSQRRGRGRRHAAGHRGDRNAVDAAAERGIDDKALTQACQSTAAPPMVPPPLAMDNSMRGSEFAGADACSGRQWRGQAWTSGPHAPVSFSSLCAGGRGVPLACPPPPFPDLRLPPWCRSGTPTAYPLSEDGLTQELVDFFHYLQLNAHESAARSRLLGRVQAAVGELWGTTSGAARVLLYGSYALGLSLPASDIDLVLTFPAEEQLDDAEGDPFPAAAKRRQELHLERLRRTQEYPPVQVDVYDQCRVPRIHLRDAVYGGISCDINSSFTSARVARTVARQRLWLQDSPLAAFLVRLTKAAVKQWGLNEVFGGGVASTALYCLVLRFLAQLEQLHRRDAVAEENLSPPRYDEVAATAACAPSPFSASPTSSATASPRESPVTRGPAAEESISTTAPAPPAAATTTVLSAVAVSGPAYVPSWALKSKKYGLSKSSSLAEVDKHDLAARRDGARLAESGSLRSGSLTACSLSRWESASSVDGVKATAVAGAGGDDDEVDRYTQAGLTHSSGAPTTATTPVSRTAASTPPLLPPPSSPSLPFECAKSSGTAPGLKPCLSAEELTRLAQARYGASPARLLLKLWRFLSSDIFLSGYQVADVFGDDAVWADCGVLGQAAADAAPSLTVQLPSTSSLELATFAGAPSADLSAASFRIPDLLALFRCTSTSLENMLRFQRYPRRDSPTMLSTIFVDPRTPTRAL